MSRTFKPTRKSFRHAGGGHRYESRTTGWRRCALNKAERQAVRAALRGELRDTGDEAREVLADLYEELGLLALAEQLRRGHDPVVPQKPAERATW